MATGPGGRRIRELLDTNGNTFDGITSTTNTTVSTESIEVPEGFQASFIIDVDTFTTADVTASVKVTHDDSNYHQFYWDEASATAATAAIAVDSSDLGYHILTIINPFTVNPNEPSESAVSATKFRVDLETDTSDSSIAYGKCFYTIGPPIKGGVFETLY